MVERRAGAAARSRRDPRSCLQYLRSLSQPRAPGEQAGIFAVCSTHPAVIHAALRRAAAGDLLLIETTSNQVNQFGGYTGMTPASFLGGLRERARAVGVPLHNVVVGSDHAGPFPWRAEPAERAMEKARGLVAECVQAGYQKIHLDATMHLADDPGDRRLPLDAPTAARRAAELCEAAETAWHALRQREKDAPPPLYVIGTDVPAPGGTEAGAAPPEVTRPDELRASREMCREAFAARGLEPAWERVIAMVVQPGVEHGQNVIHRYDRARVRDLLSCRRDTPGLVFEAHATDYQSSRALRQMVEDGFAILKVGPSLTAAVRESLFLLDHLEEALAPLHPAMKRSRVPEALEQAMLADPVHWTAYYRGDEAQRAFFRKYALSDRCRYYWEVPGVKAAVSSLIANLRTVEIPAGLLSQYFPRQFLRLVADALPPDPEAIIAAHVDEVLDRYDAAIRLR